ncbi:MAG TPA: acetaldehyde dehydrogenase (acetylating) [Gaiellaceae bacterium]|nr:acetaldehyde dehydrogenase (acetylating) [Gaiellaceae bacterium]
MSPRVQCAVLGSGNIGTDLMAKLLQSETLELTAVVGVDPESKGLARAKVLGLDAPAEGVDWLVEHSEQAAIVFEATSASAHRANAPRLAEAGLRSIDLTPAKLGPGVVPVVNLEHHADAPDLNLISCGGQATIPVVAAIAEQTAVPYAEIVAAISSKSAGPGTRQSIDEFTRTTAKGLEEIGGAERGKAIIILNPAEPPILMRNTIFCTVASDVDQDAIAANIFAMAERVAAYVPGYRLRADPIFDEERLTVIVEVEGAGDFLPRYAGNLDVMTAAAVRVGERLAQLGAVA